MSSKSSRPGSLGGPTVVQIRPAIPLMYEPRPRGGGNVFEVEEEPEEAENPIQDAEEQPSESPRPGLDMGKSLQTQPAGDVSLETRSATKREVAEMEKDRLEMSRLMAGEAGEGSQQRHDRNTSSPEDLEKPLAEEGARRSILGVKIKNEGAPSMGQEEHLSHATSSQHSSNPARVSTGHTYNNSPTTASNLGATHFVPPVNYPAPYVQFGSYMNGIAAQQMYANPYIGQPHHPQAQYRFPQAWHEVPQFSQFGGQPPPTPSSASLDDGYASLDPKLVGHISSNFNVERYADIRLVVSHERERFKETMIFLHRILVSRSETIRGLLDEHAGNYDVNDGKLVVKLRLSDRFITPTALAMALQTCYGQSAKIFPPSVARGQVAYHYNQSVADMHEILAFATAGHLLKLEDVALRAIEKAQEALTWDDLEHALSFGMESCTHRHESSDALLLKSFSYSTLEGDTFSVDCAPFMLDLCLSFMASFFPDSWLLDRSVQRLPIVDRLPLIGEPPQRNVKSSLARIQFGQVPLTEDPKVVDRDQLISRIVLSVPFSSLCRIATEKPPSLMRQLPQIIEEREHRRLAALDSDVHWNQRRLGKDTEWHAVVFEESYTPTDPNDGALGLSSTPVSIYSTAADEEEAKKRDEASLGLVENPQGAELLQGAES